MSMSPKVAHYAVMAGLCALVPVPILDGWLERRALRSMYAAIAESTGRPLDDATLDLLAEDRDSLLVGCLVVAVVWPLKKLFRTVFYFLTVKDAVDGVAAAAVRAAMVHAALGRLPHGAKGVRDVMDATLGRWQYSPVSRFVMRGERPPATWLLAADDLGVGWVYRHAGGAAILADFEARLEKLP